VDVILSINPIYISEMRIGRKKYEYRKRIFRKSVDKIYIYSTSPIKKIVGYVLYQGYIEGTPNEVWESTKYESGISEEFFFEYYSNAQKAYAIDFSKIIFFDKPVDPIKVDRNFYAPQSYRYVKDDVNL
jgi:predicted transcriptional regulator